jgi:hypothetical protein
MNVSRGDTYRTVHRHVCVYTEARLAQASQGMYCTSTSHQLRSARCLLFFLLAASTSVLVWSSKCCFGAPNPSPRLLAPPLGWAGVLYGFDAATHLLHMYCAVQPRRAWRARAGGRVITASQRAAGRPKREQSEGERAERTRRRAGSVVVHTVQPSCSRTTSHFSTARGGTATVGE